MSAHIEMLDMDVKAEQVTDEPRQIRVVLTQVYIVSQVDSPAEAIEEVIR